MADEGEETSQPAASQAPSAKAPEASSSSSPKTVEELKDLGNAAFKKSQLLRTTTAGKQYLQEAKVFYGQALGQLGSEEASDKSLSLACTLHANLAAVFLLEMPPNWPAAKASCDIALSVNPAHVKALFRRAQACLEDEREGLPEDCLRSALADFRAALAAEPGNKQASAEAERVGRRLALLEAARKIPEPEEVAKKINSALLDRGGDLLRERGYLWGQTESVVHVFVPAQGMRIAKASDVKCEVKVQCLSISLPKANGERLELEGKLLKRVQPDESSWQLEEKGLLLHVELAKYDESSEGEHWLSVWQGHPCTKAPSAEERKNIKDMARGACLAEEREKQKPKAPKHPAADETVRKLRELCPGVNIEWGDTTLD